MNPLYLKDAGKPLDVRLERACEEAELDERWSLVGNKSNQRWLWYAVDHATNTGLVYAFGKRRDTVFQDLKALLAPLNINRYFTDDWGAYERHLDTGKHEVGKRNTQQIERKNLNFRTWIKRLARRSICFSKLESMHDVVIGLLINESTRLILPKLQDGLLEAMKINDWPVTFSIGALTCRSASTDPDGLLRIVDDLMYSVKSDGKNSIKYATYKG